MPRQSYSNVPGRLGSYHKIRKEREVPVALWLDASFNSTFCVVSYHRMDQQQTTYPIYLETFKSHFQGLRSRKAFWERKKNGGARSSPTGNEGVFRPALLCEGLTVTQFDQSFAASKNDIFKISLFTPKQNEMNTEN